jgi:4,5-DOPA dioxygenase extradiol
MEAVKRAPALFTSHGSPMNAILENAYTADLRSLGEQLRDVKAVLVISAHWETNGLHATASETLSTYHDFRGFPAELHAVQYPVKGALELIPEIERLTGEKVSRDSSRGLDHGAWSMLAHLFSDRSKPVLQLSIDRSRTFAGHLELAKKLAPLREQNVLILASGNVTHNFSHADFRNMDAAPLPWAVQFDDIVKNAFLNNDADVLIHMEQANELFRMNHPSPDHFIPLLYLMGVKHEEDKVSFPHMSWQAATMSMRHILLK